jgi:integrase
MVTSELKGGEWKSGKGVNMQNLKVIDFTQYRDDDDRRPKRKRSKKRLKGSVYGRNGKLWVDFRYLGERVREPSGLADTPLNRKAVRKQLNLITAEIDNGLFEFAERFPHSSRKAYFAELEGNRVKRKPDEILFQDYVERWFPRMKPGMSESQVRDYTSILKSTLLPRFGKKPFSEFWSRIRMKEFIVELKARKNRFGKPLSGKRIQNIMIPLRVIVKDAIDEYEWYDLHDPFAGLKLPKARKSRIYPFRFQEWQVLRDTMLDWYKPYFDFAVQTGLRPSEQVALKWTDIDDHFIHIERSRVRNKEKDDLKTEESRRAIEIRPAMREVLDAQFELTRAVKSPYVFINTEGRPILQDKLREVWARVMEKSGLMYRRMYETRHTFASWALAAGESPHGWREHWDTSTRP